MPPKKVNADQSSSQKRTIRRWTVDENNLILEYLSETIRQGYSIEKPTAAKYYQNLIQQTGLTDCDEDLVKNKVRNFRTTFIAALKWQSETGQGIKESEGEESFEVVLAKRYPYLKLMEEIWGERLNVNPPFVAESTSSQVRLQDDEEQFVEYRNVAIDDEGNIVAIDIASDTDELSDEVRGPSQNKEKKIPEASEKVSVKKAEKKLLAKTGNATTAKGAYEELMKHREESMQQKLKLQQEQLQLEKDRFKDSVELSRSKFDFEKIKFEAEMKLKEKELATKELQIQADKEVRLKEIELQLFKLSQQSKESNS